MAVKLPKPWPKLLPDPVALLEWASKATKHEITYTWRPGRTESSALVVRLADGLELFFETVAEACRPDRFITAFMADGVVMPTYSAGQVKEIVGALIRAAKLERDRDERDRFAEFAGRFLRGCLTQTDVMPVALEDSERLYRTAVAYINAIARLRGESGEPFPPVLHAVDGQVMFIPRGLLLAHAGLRMAPATFNAQIRRIGWEDVNLRPRRPGNPNAPRPHLRLWRIPDGWDGITPSPGIPARTNLGPAVPGGPTSTGVRAGPRELRIAHAGARDHESDQESDR